MYSTVIVDLSKLDLRTVLCKNLESIALDCNAQSRNLNKFCVKQNMIYNHTPLDQEWKLPVLHDLLKVYVPTRNYIYILYFILVFILSYCTILPLCTK